MMVIIKNALENIKTNKLRVLVAMVWIVLGITSVVVVSSIGNGIEKQGEMSSQKDEFRKNVISFYPNHESNLDSSFYEPFTQEDIGILSGMSEIERVTPKYGENYGGDYGGTIFLNGDYKFTKTSEYKEGDNVDLAYGRSFSLEDFDRKTIILDYNIAYDLADEIPQNAVGKSVNLEGEDFEVIGVLKQVISDTDEGEYIEPESYLSEKSLDNIEAKRSFGGPITALEILVKKEYDVDEVGFLALEKIQDGKPKENGEYNLTGNNSGAFELMYLQDTINKFTAVLSNVALIIGGIGIMNIMYMSVSERKREIGIRRAIGAEPKDILIQFLIETIVITILGGVVGMIVGTIAAFEVGPYIGISVILSSGVYVKAVVVSILTGAIFGAIPALKAARLDPIKAIQG